MAITFNDLGTAQSTAGTAGTTATLSSVGGTNGNLLVLLGFFLQADAGSSNPTMTLTGTWSGTWTKRESVYRTPGAGTYKTGVEIYTSPISGSPSGTIIYTNPLTVTDGWMGFHVFEVIGQAASPIGLHANGGEIDNNASYAVDLGSAPAATSLVLGGVLLDFITGSAVTPPTGWTEADEQNPSPFGAAAEWATKNGSASQVSTWTGMGATTCRNFGAAIEILAAAASSVKQLAALGVG